MVDKLKFKLIAELCTGWESESYKSAFLELINELKRQKIELDYQIVEVEDNSLEIYVEKNLRKTKVFSRKLTGKWLNSSNIPLVVKKIIEIIQWSAIMSVIICDSE